MQRNKLMILFVILMVVFIILISLSIVIVATPVSNFWANKITQIDKLHELGFDGTGVTIGIVDTGVSIDHQDFDSSSFIAWIDTINHYQQYYDDEDHGTHISGILASKDSLQGIFSGIKIKGIADKADFVIAKSIPQNQYIFKGGNNSTIETGIQFCIDNEVDIILLSMGLGPDFLDFNENSKTIEIIDHAIELGIFVVVPAGNDGQNDDGDVCFPATLENVISVGAISKVNAILSFSSKGHQYPDTQHPNKKPELMAPGDRIISTRVNGSYGEISGTSQAAAYVAGIIALLLDAYPEYKHDGIKNFNVTTIKLFKEIFAITAKKIGNLINNDNEWSHDYLYGYGLIQAYDAYKELAKY